MMQVLRSLTARSAKLLPNFRPADVANIAYAYGKLSFHPGTLLDDLARHAEQNISSFTAAELTALVCAFGQLEHHPGRHSNNLRVLWLSRATGGRDGLVFGGYDCAGYDSCDVKAWDVT